MNVCKNEQMEFCWFSHSMWHFNWVWDIPDINWSSWLTALDYKETDTINIFWETDMTTHGSHRRQNAREWGTRSGSVYQAELGYDQMLRTPRKDNFPMCHLLILTYLSNLIYPDTLSGIQGIQFPKPLPFAEHSMFFLSVTHYLRIHISLSFLTSFIFISPLFHLSISSCFSQYSGIKSIVWGDDIQWKRCSQYCWIAEI